MPVGYIDLLGFLIRTIALHVCISKKVVRVVSRAVIVRAGDRAATPAFWVLMVPFQTANSVVSVRYYGKSLALQLYIT